MGKPTIAPAHQGDKGRREVNPSFGQVILIAGRPVLVSDLDQHIVFHELGQPVSENVPRYLQVGLHFAESTYASEHVS